MRPSLALLAMLSAAPAAAAPRASDPAFLGIVMSGQQLPTGGCLVTDVTPNSGASAVGVRPGDVIVKIDKVAITSCTALIDIVAARQIGESIELVMTTMSNPLQRAAIAQLGSRVDIMRKAMIGKPVDAQLVAADDNTGLDLVARTKGRATIVGWFHPACSDCEAVFDRVARWQRKTKNLAYAVTTFPHDPSNPVALTKFRDALHLDVPLAVTDTMPDTQPLMFERERIMFTVIDCRGDVSYVSPIAPGSDDEGAMLDDLFVAADHAQLRTRP